MRRPPLATLMSCLMALGSGCVSTLPIYSRPPGAEVVMDETKELGPTPILLKEQVWVWTSHSLTFTKEGYKPETVEVSASARPVSLALCSVGVCFMWMLWPVALLGRYRGELIVRLELDPAATGPFGGSDLREPRTPEATTRWVDEPISLHFE